MEIPALKVMYGLLESSFTLFSVDKFQYMAQQLKGFGKKCSIVIIFLYR